MKDKKNYDISVLPKADEIFVFEEWNKPDEEIYQTKYSITIFEREFFAIPYRTFADAKRMKKIVFCKVIEREKWNENYNSKQTN